jgi:hypothetical protein
MDNRDNQSTGRSSRMANAVSTAEKAEQILVDLVFIYCYLCEFSFTQNHCGVLQVVTDATFTGSSLRGDYVPGPFDALLAKFVNCTCINVMLPRNHLI